MPMSPVGDEVAVIFFFRLVLSYQTINIINIKSYIV